MSRKRIFGALTGACPRESGGDRLVRERTAHINRIKGLLFGQGIRSINVKSRYKSLKPAELVTGDGRALPDRLGREITREIERLAQLQAQIVEIERERDKAPTLCVATERKRHDLLRLKGLGPSLSSTLAREVYYRQFANRRQVASYLGVTPSPYDSGDGHRSQGISKAGNRLARVAMVEAAWLCAGILALLLARDSGVASRSLLGGDEKIGDVLAEMAYLSFYHWVGANNRWQRIWLSSESRQLLSQ